VREVVRTWPLAQRTGHAGFDLRQMPRRRRRHNAWISGVWRSPRWHYQRFTPQILGAKSPTMGGWTCLRVALNPVFPRPSSLNTRDYPAPGTAQRRRPQSILRRNDVRRLLTTPSGRGKRLSAPAISERILTSTKCSAPELTVDPSAVPLATDIGHPVAAAVRHRASWAAAVGQRTGDSPSPIEAQCESGRDGLARKRN
jgi:hypothetical protein